MTSTHITSLRPEPVRQLVGVHQFEDDRGRAGDRNLARLPPHYGSLGRDTQQGRQSLDRQPVALADGFDFSRGHSGEYSTVARTKPRFVDRRSAWATPISRRGCRNVRVVPLSQWMVTSQGFGAAARVSRRARIALCSVISHSPLAGWPVGQLVEPLWGQNDHPVNGIMRAGENNSTHITGHRE